MFFYRHLIFLLLLNSFIYADPYEHCVEDILNNGHTLNLPMDLIGNKEDFDESQKLAAW